MAEQFTEQTVIRRSSHGRVYPVARVLIGLIFVISGVGKLLQFEASLQYMAASGLPENSVLLGIATGIELLAGFALLAGFLTRYAAWILAVYLVPVTLVFHTNWGDPAQLFHFLKNLAIIGGLLQTAVVDRSVRVLRRLEPQYEESDTRHRKSA